MRDFFYVATSCTSEPEARMEMLQTRAPAELAKYLEELRSKAYVEIKK